MQAQPILRLPFSIRFAHYLNRVLSWGMPHQERLAFLAETLADWEEMKRDRGSMSIFARSLRGIPTGIWARFDEHETTALPAAVAAALVGGAGTAAGLLDTYPLDIRRFIFLSSWGALLLGATLLRDPRRIVLRRHRLSGLILAAGFWGVATNMPSQADWPYDAPFVDAVLADVAMVVGFTLVGVGFALIVIASFVTPRRIVTRGAGLAIMTGTALFAGGQIAWGIVAVTTDPAITATSIGIGLASLSCLHVVPRLGRLQLV